MSGAEDRAWPVPGAPQVPLVSSGLFPWSRPRGRDVGVGGAPRCPRRWWALVCPGVAQAGGGEAAAGNVGLGEVLPLVFLCVPFHFSESLL